MPDDKENWSSTQAYTLAVICLLAGLAGGWLFRGSQPAEASVPVASANSAPTGMAGGASAQPTPEQMKKMADTAAAPQLEKLKSDPNDPDVLASIGNTYYDAQLFPTAIDYYQRALQVRPQDVSVRTDMGTAYWYIGQADAAIEEFNKALSYDPNKPNTLFNLGMVKWQDKMDIEGAVTAWQKLLEKNPNYEGKEKVEQLIAQARKHSGVKPGTPAKALSQ